MEAIEADRAAPGTVLLLTKDVIRAGRIAHALTCAGLVVTLAFDTSQMRSRVKDLDVHVIVVDLHALGPEPELALRAIHRDSAAPILALTAGTASNLEQLFGSGVSAVTAIDAGALELGAQVRALLGLADPLGSSASRARSFGALTVDPGRRLVRL